MLQGHQAGFKSRNLKTGRKRSAQRDATGSNAGVADVARPLQRKGPAGDDHVTPDSIEGKTASASAGVIATRGSWTGRVRRQSGVGVDARPLAGAGNWPFVDLSCRGRDADAGPGRRQLSPEFGDQLPGTYRF
jgi:hypothetical protein